MTVMAENAIGRDNILFCIMINQSRLDIGETFEVINLLKFSSEVSPAIRLVLESLVELDAAANVECHPSSSNPNQQSFF